MVDIGSGHTNGKTTPSGRKARENDKHDSTDYSVPKMRQDTPLPRRKHTLPERLDRDKLMSPPRALPSATGHLPSTQEHAKGSPSMILRAQVGQGSSPRYSPNLPQDRKKIPASMQ